MIVIYIKCIYFCTTETNGKKKHLKKFFPPFSFEEIFSLVVELDPASPALLLALLHDLLRPLLESL